MSDGGADSAWKHIAARETSLEHALPELGTVRKKVRCKLAIGDGQLDLPGAIGSRIMVISAPSFTHALRV